MDEITVTTPPDPELPGPAPTLPFRRPADYYSGPVDAKPLFAPWVPYGCGIAAVIALLAIFGAGYAASSGGFGQLFDLLFSSIQGEVDKAFTREVTPAEKAEFDAQMKTMREALRDNRLRIDHIQPLLRSIRESSGDGKVTPEETEQLIRELRAVNRTVKR
ncbi:MAG TPA: hypothetical protein VKH35_12375 [Thermoanaerobaculia bacterium]|nr:hypothetical protein [Thermoanaerobaculia bacterium]